MKLRTNVYSSRNTSPHLKIKNNPRWTVTQAEKTITKHFKLINQLWMWGGNEAGEICDSTVDCDYIQDYTQTILSTPETVTSDRKWWVSESHLSTTAQTVITYPWWMVWRAFRLLCSSSAGASSTPEQLTPVTRKLSTCLHPVGRCVFVTVHV